MRAQKTSSIRSPVLAKLWVWTPSWKARLSTASGIPAVPKNPATNVVTAPVTQPCPDGYSGWGGVALNDCQDASCCKSEVPPPAKIAVTGRQKLYLYLPSQQPIAASANPVHRTAIRRAVSFTLSFCASARPLNIRAYCCPVCSVQKIAISRSLVERIKESEPPSA